MFSKRMKRMMWKWTFRNKISNDFQLFGIPKKIIQVNINIPLNTKLIKLDFLEKWANQITPINFSKPKWPKCQPRSLKMRNPQNRKLVHWSPESKNLTKFYSKHFAMTIYYTKESILLNEIVKSLIDAVEFKKSLKIGFLWWLVFLTDVLNMVGATK